MPCEHANVEATQDAARLRHRLRHVRWIGGGSGAGKSTVARRIADRHGWAVYSTDAVMGEHAARSNPSDAPQLAAFMDMSMDQRWVDRDPSTMLETFHWYRGEGFDHIVEDLTSLPPDRPVVAEGFRLLPALVAPLLEHPGYAVWLLPTPRFRQAAFDSRGTTSDITDRTSDPAQALQNLLERDRLFTDRLRAETHRLGLTSIDVDITMTEDDLVESVGTALGL